MKEKEITEDQEYWKNNKLNLWTLEKRWHNRGGINCITLRGPDHIPHNGYQEVWGINASTFRSRKYELISKVADMENQYDSLLNELEILETADKTNEVSS